MNSSGASLSTPNHDNTSVSSSLIGCHCRRLMKGSTSSESATFGQLCTKDRFGYSEAALSMYPSRRSRRVACRTRPFHPADHLVGIADVTQSFLELAGRQLVGCASAVARPIEHTFFAFLGAGFTEQADLDDRTMRVGSVVLVAGEVLGADLPIGLDAPTLRAAQFDPLLLCLV